MTNKTLSIDLAAIKVGDRITFKSPTRYSFRKATRVVNGFLWGRPTVRFGGWADFAVRPWEIIEHHPKERKSAVRIPAVSAAMWAGVLWMDVREAGLCDIKARTQSIVGAESIY